MYPGVYYVECGADFTISVTAAIHIMNPATGQDRILGRLERTPSLHGVGLAVSSDGTTILYNKVVNDGADLMLIENFR